LAAEASATVGIDDIRRAARAGAEVIRETPVLSFRTLGERSGGEVVLKAENLQRTGSFKLRGALAKLAALGASCRDGGGGGERGQSRTGGGVRGQSAWRPV
jgi:threonine dehydratase